jgi:hypothetical protein
MLGGRSYQNFSNILPQDHAEGFARPYTGLYLDYIWVRRRIPRLDLRPYISLRSYIYSR